MSRLTITNNHTLDS